MITVGGIVRHDDSDARRVGVIGALPLRHIVSRLIQRIKVPPTPALGDGGIEREAVPEPNAPRDEKRRMEDDRQHEHHERDGIAPAAARRVYTGPINQL